MLNERCTETIDQLSQDEEAAVIRVPRMLRELCHKVEILNTYCADLQSLTTQLKESCVETGLAMLSFFSQVVKFLRSDIVYSTPGK